MSFLSICTYVGKILHWCTGWLAHPEKGGCSSHQNPFDLIDDDSSESSKK